MAALAILSNLALAHSKSYRTTSHLFEELQAMPAQTRRADRTISFHFIFTPGLDAQRRSVKGPFPLHQTTADAVVPSGRGAGGELNGIGMLVSES